MTRVESDCLLSYGKDRAPNDKLLRETYTVDHRFSRLGMGKLGQGWPVAQVLTVLYKVPVY